MGKLVLIRKIVKNPDAQGAIPEIERDLAEKGLLYLEVRKVVPERVFAWMQKQEKAGKRQVVGEDGVSVMIVQDTDSAGWKEVERFDQDTQIPEKYKGGKQVQTYLPAPSLEQTLASSSIEDLEVLEAMIKAAKKVREKRLQSEKPEPELPQA